MEVNNIGYHIRAFEESFTDWLNYDVHEKVGVASSSKNTSGEWGRR